MSSRALAFSAAFRSTAHHPAPKTPTGRPFRDGPSSSSAAPPRPQRRKKPLTLSHQGLACHGGRASTKITHFIQ
ncbi:hypothetical protein DESPIG_02135 [Desulfovibrio piger ATCC 29098]|uniref:Uncharacterized protein n=1 Tax=Desulfovibrio piger ATCC 29098 TaxID=411464 RepID=B6WVL7_9BACT|nr:hypothetical protein DESPIG_02135 [Desulfovibrio piger ATCC 29098]